MKLYRSRPVTAEVVEHNVLGNKRYSVTRSDGFHEWLTAGELATKFDPLDGIGWASVTREENA